MGLLNDIRFYLMAALAVLFLIIVAMCSSAYDGSTDGHADSGVNKSQDSTMSAESGAKAEADKVAAEVEAPKVENAAVETKEVETKAAETEEVVAKEVETTAVEKTEPEVQAIASDVKETATATADASTATTEEATETATTTVESAVVSTVDKFELTPLTDTGEAVPDFNNNIGILKSDLGRYGNRLEEAQKAIEKLKEATK